MGRKYTDCILRVVELSMGDRFTLRGLMAALVGR